MEQQKPSPGRIVMFRQAANEHPRNGSRDHPAVVTRVFDGYVNLTVIWDAGVPTPMSTVPPVAEGDDANYGWYWPPRV